MKTQTFKDEIRTSFLHYSLLPSIIVTIIMFFLIFSIWGTSIARNIIDENNQGKEEIVDVMSDLAAYLQSPQIPSLSQIKEDSNIKIKAYSDLCLFVNQRKFQTSFLLFDSEMNLFFHNDEAQIEYERSWGTIGRMKENPYETIIEVTNEYSPNKDYELLIGKGIIRDYDVDGFLLFRISEKEFISALKDIQTYVAITNQFGTIFFSTSDAFTSQFHKIDTNYLTVKEGMNVINNHLVYRKAVFDNQVVVISVVNVFDYKVALLTTIILLLIIIFVTSIGMIKGASKIAKEKTLVIDQICDAYKIVEKGNFDNRITVKSNLEFETIASAHNHMLDKIKNLIELNNKETMEKYLSEIKQLEMQFNPHFLFNTLETIKYLVKLNPDLAQESIVGLSEILRYSIDNTISTISLEDDLSYVESYLKILRARFGNRLDFSIQIGDESKKTIIPKLIVQPLIENAIKYGFNGKSTLNINIMATQEEKGTRIKVMDNGKGIEEELLEELKKNLYSNSNKSKHIGLYNVSRRLQLLYGDKAILHIESKVNYGTSIDFIIPKERDEH